MRFTQDLGVTVKQSCLWSDCLPVFTAQSKTMAMAGHFTATKGILNDVGAKDDVK